MPRLTSLFAILLLTACGPESPLPAGSIADSDLTDIRPAVDALDKTTADARKARISNIEYDAYIDIAASEEDIIGELSARFDLSDAISDLTLDFTGGTVSSLRVNGEAISDAYNGYFITLPAEELQLGANAIELEYRRPYGRDGTGLHRFVDPEDGRTYMHSYLWPYYANRLVPSFDQPSLKATFSLRVRARRTGAYFP